MKNKLCCEYHNPLTCYNVLNFGKLFPGKQFTAPPSLSPAKANKRGREHQPFPWRFLVDRSFSHVKKMIFLHFIIIALFIMDHREPLMGIEEM